MFIRHNSFNFVHYIKKINKIIDKWCYLYIYLALVRADSLSVLEPVKVRVENVTPDLIEIHQEMTSEEPAHRYETTDIFITSLNFRAPKFNVLAP